MNKYLFFFIFLVSFFKTQSQENRSFLYATVKDKIGPVINAHILNKNTKQGTFTNENGEFRILAKSNDSLQISFVGYETSIFNIEIKHFGIQKTIFELLKTNYELDEVNIKQNNLLGYLSADSKNIKTEKKINAKTLKLPYAGSKLMTPAERRLYTAMGARNILSVDYILNSISGRIKKLRKLKKIETLERKVSKIKNTYSIHIIKEYKIKEFDIYKFIYFCTDDKKFNQAYNSSKINMIRFLKNKAETFKKLNPENYN
ncbi:carboxypeptidase-like regulatory domain-containing protein [Tenacibaculum ovolyticum]|uniref:carboxypeptidase-like regulatory domain-containing protein n=1 Tax=Tenacibaculum ovolyticum TaxID=104270 RepID=UPI001F1DEFE2|nr:carboxypeptidase-like regulatory domain-containing protein [Tenacibaculum ovolyticum]